jgi:hypothetical protein
MALSSDGTVEPDRRESLLEASAGRRHAALVPVDPTGFL